MTRFIGRNGKASLTVWGSLTKREGPCPRCDGDRVPTRHELISHELIFQREIEKHNLLYVVNYHHI